MTHSRARRVAAVGGCIVVMAASLSGCASGRSTEAFCSTYWEEKNAYLQRYGTAAEEIRAAGDEDPFAALLGGTAMIAQALGDTIVIFDKLERVAPDDIQPDVAAIRDNLKAQMERASDAVSNPLGSLVGGLVQGLAVGGSWQRVGDYVVTHCGEKG